MTDLPSARRGQFRLALRIAGYTLALALLVASIWFAFRDQQLAPLAILGRADPALALLLVIVVIFSAIVLPGLQFWVATRPFVTAGALSLGTMQLITAASSLLNYTPFKAGLIARIGYLKSVHGVGLRAAALIHAVLGGAFVATAALGLALVWWRQSVAGGGGLLLPLVGGLFLALVLVSAVGAPVLRLLVRYSAPEGVPLTASLGGAAAYLGATCGLQALGLAATALRWYLVFRVGGQAIGVTDAGLAAVVHQSAVILGPANGIGVREWLIGIAAQQGLLATGLLLTLGAGMTIALVDRLVEALVLVVGGTLSLALLRRRTAVAAVRS